MPGRKRPPKRPQADPRLELARLVDRLGDRHPAVTMTVIVQAIGRTPIRGLSKLSPDELFVLVDAAVSDSLLLKDLRTFFDRQTGTHDEVWVFRVNARHPLAAKLLEG